MNSYLEARDQRQEALTQVLGAGHPTVACLSLNVPGAEKQPAGAEALFAWALREAQALGLSSIATSLDALGHFAVLASDRDAAEVKRSAVVLETQFAAARLIDLDVYRASSDAQIGRQESGMPARTCLLCDLPAVECMRVKRHPLNDVVAKAYELLANFSA